jgi:hypothetical protein
MIFVGRRIPAPFFGDSEVVLLMPDRGKPGGWQHRNIPRIVFTANALWSK